MRKRNTQAERRPAGLPARREKAPPPAPPALPPKRPTPEEAFNDHMVSLAAGVYKGQLAGLVKGRHADELLGCVFPFLKYTLEQLGPRDPLEELLIGQMLWTHLRLAELSHGASKQQSVEWAAMMHEAADRAANTFRRQMLALSEYRNPRRGNSFAAIQRANIAQANIANQQFVQQQNRPRPGGGVDGGIEDSRNLRNENATNEQGCPGTSEYRPKALPSDGGRPCGVADVGGAEPAVAQKHRATDTQR